MTEFLVLGIEPIRVVSGEPGAHASGGSSWTSGGLVWMEWGLLALGVVGVGVAAVWLWRWARPRMEVARDPEERAFRALARKLRLRRAQRGAVRELAGMVEAPPVALLLCRGVFVRAVGLREAGDDAAARGRMLELEHRVYG